MVGSAQSIALANITLNAIISDSLDAFATRLEKADDIEKEVRRIACDTYAEHHRIIMNGNNYSDEWQQEARRRGLPEYKNALDAAEIWHSPETIDLFGRYGILSELECRSRYEIALENYRKITIIEARTLLEMMHRQVIPAVISAAGKNAASLKNLNDVGVENASLLEYVKSLSESVSLMTAATEKLSDDVDALSDECNAETDRYIRDVICSDMQEIRRLSDSIERVVERSSWPMPTYTDLMHRV